MPNRPKRIFLNIIFLFLIAFNTASGQCIPHCSMDDSCIAVVKPAAGDTIVESDVLPIEFVVGIDLVTAHISIDSGKSWIGLLTNAITVTPCTTWINRIHAPLLDSILAKKDTKIQACKIRISAYGASKPSGISSGYFFITRRNSSVHYNYLKPKPKLSEYAENKLYNFLGQAVNSKALHRDGIYLLVNNRGKMMVFNKTFPQTRRERPF